MISTIADLLDALKNQETKLLDEQNISHAPTIGNMYEGLTKEILEQALPSKLELNVFSGFITNKNGGISKQIDCMLVDGVGEKIPYTDNYKCDIENVIAVIEVKKNLYSDELDSAYKNLASVRKLTNTPKTINKIFIDSFRQILQSDPRNYDDLNKLPYWKRQVGIVLYQQSILPIRVAFGYHGFSNEYSFREAFVEYLHKNLNSSGFSPIDFPDLIVSNKHSLIKLNGMPYGIPIFKERQEAFSIFGLHENPDDIPPITRDLWACYASYPSNPMLLLLQILWTRLTYIERVSGEIFGLDLDVEFLRPLMLAKAIEQKDNSGWHYEYFYLSEKYLKSIPLSLKWKPVEIDAKQAAILTFLGKLEYDGVYEISINDPRLLLEDMTLDSLKESTELLMKTHLLSLENGVLRLLTKECVVIVTLDGKFWAGDNSDPRLMDWFSSYPKMGV